MNSSGDGHNLIWGILAILGVIVICYSITLFPGVIDIVDPRAEPTPIPSPALHRVWSYPTPPTGESFPPEKVAQFSNGIKWTLVEDTNLGPFYSNPLSNRIFQSGDGRIYIKVKVTIENPTDRNFSFQIELTNESREKNAYSVVDGIHLPTGGSVPAKTIKEFNYVYQGRESPYHLYIVAVDSQTTTEQTLLKLDSF